MKEQVRLILAGPDRFKLATRLFDGHLSEQRPVSFTVKEKDGSQKWDEHIKLSSAEREDGSGDCWNLTGYSMANHAYVKMFYNLKTREGSMTFGLYR